MQNKSEITAALLFEASKPRAGNTTKNINSLIFFVSIMLMKYINITTAKIHHSFCTRKQPSPCNWYSKYQQQTSSGCQFRILKDQKIITKKIKYWI